VELFEAIRRDRRVDESISIRGLADRHGVHRRTVRAALASAVPPERKAPVRVAPVLDPVRAVIDAMLLQDLDAPRKQRHTARRVTARLADEHDVVVSYSTVRDYVRLARPRVFAQAGKALEETFIVQEHPAGEGAEVDFADLWVWLRGVKVKTYLFTFRLSHSGKAVHRAYGSACQEAFLDGHRHAFEQLGGVPTGPIRYDNLKAAVSKVTFGRTRTESARWVAFRSHYGFDAFYCRPGKDGAHEKGGVEGEGGRFRRTHLVPMPQVDTLTELNDLLARADVKDENRRIGHRVRTVEADYLVEKPLLRPLPGEAFETGITLTPRVDRHSRITVRQCTYSVPARLVGQRVRVLLRADTVVVFDGRVQVATHARSTVRGSTTLVLDHYLEVLARKPGALPGATALAQARAAGTFTPTHEAFWAAARAAHGDGEGTKALVEVLLLHRHHTAQAVTAGISAALAVGATSPDVVAMETRRAITTDARPPAPAGTVLTLPNQPVRAVVLPPDTRPVPSVQAYDQLLTRRPNPPPGPPNSTEGEQIS
jgi:transposase